MNEDKYGDLWIGYIGKDLYNIRIPEHIKNDPKTHYNSLEGIETRKRSKVIMDSLKVK